MNLPEEETLCSVEPVELRIPMPWGHAAAKAWGNVEGKPVLAVHGWMDNAGTFDKLIPKLSKALYIVTVDLPGHGLSSHIPAGVPFHYFDLVLSLRIIVNYLKWSKFCWLGHSMGAGLGSYYASLYPAQIERLVLLDLIKAVTAETNQELAGTMAVSVDAFINTLGKLSPLPPSYTYSDALGRQMAAIGGKHPEETAKTLMIRGCKKISEWEDKWSFTRDIRLRSPSIPGISDEQCFAILQNINCQLLLIKATEAPYFQSKEVCNKALEIYEEKCALFEFVEVEGDHFVHLNEPFKIAGMVNKFLLEPRPGL